MRFDSEYLNCLDLIDLWGSLWTGVHKLPQRSFSFPLTCFGTEAFFLSILVPTEQFGLMESYLPRLLFLDFRYRSINSINNRP